MDAAGIAIPDVEHLDAVALKQLVREQNQQLLAKDDDLRVHKLEIERLNLLIAKLRRLQYGKKSEKYQGEIEQLELRVEELQTTDAQIEASKQQAAAASSHHAQESL